MAGGAARMQVMACCTASASSLVFAASASCRALIKSERLVAVAADAPITLAVSSRSMCCSLFTCSVYKSQHCFTEMEERTSSRSKLASSCQCSSASSVESILKHGEMSFSSGADALSRSVFEYARCWCTATTKSAKARPGRDGSSSAGSATTPVTKPRIIAAISLNLEKVTSIETASHAPFSSMTRPSLSRSTNSQSAEYSCSVW
mmetsp:Transcript_10568/g.24484  ORF Transcript_10568/g.24484 Transcript_10568/m.24484 type:complete len:205 (-) Transcript_10568:2360-2974(-)